MATELIHFNGKGFLTSDLFMQLAIYYINEEFKKSQYVLIDKNILLDHHKEIINGHMAGWFALLWDSYITNSADVQTMVQVLQNVKITLQNKGAFISVNELQAIPTEDGDFKHLYKRYPFPTAELIKIVDALIQMLQGTWTSTNYDMDINY